MRIAVVEDDPDIAPMLDKLLKLEGFQVTVVRDGREAVQTLSTGSFQAAVIDVMLPGMDGISILRAIREGSRAPDLPVVMLTARTDDQTTWEGWKAGANYFMPKPFDPEVLVRVLRSVIEQSEPGNA